MCLHVLCLLTLIPSKDYHAYMCTPMSFTGSAPAVFDPFQSLSCVHVHTHVLYWICACRSVCFALNVPSPSALHPPHLGGIWIDSANGIKICGFLAWVQLLMLKFRWTFSDTFFLNMDSMCICSCIFSLSLSSRSYGA